MKKQHKEIWYLWCLDFVQLFNQGYSLKQIMKKYNTLFSWTVIAQQIIKTAEENKIKLAPPMLKIGSWEPDVFNQEVTTLGSFQKGAIGVFIMEVIGETGRHRSHVILFFDILVLMIKF